MVRYNAGFSPEHARQLTHPADCQQTTGHLPARIGKQLQPPDASTSAKLTARRRTRDQLARGGYESLAAFAGDEMEHVAEIKANHYRWSGTWEIAASVSQLLRRTPHHDYPRRDDRNAKIHAVSEITVVASQRGECLIASDAGGLLQEPLSG